MKMKVVSGLAAVTLTCSCVATTFPVKQGVTFDRYERDTVSCAAESTRQVPTNTQVAWAPYVGIYSVDTNAQLRGKSNEICLRDKGYEMMQIPYCGSALVEAANTAARATRDRKRVMRVSPESCYVIAPNGQPFLYTP